MTCAFLIRKVQRPARFEGSHLGEADLILGLIALIVTTLLCWHASRIALGINEWPKEWSPVSRAIAVADGARRLARGARADLRVDARADDPRSSSSYLPHSKHLHIATAGINVWFGRTRAPGQARAARLRGRGRERDAARRGDARRHDLEADGRHDVVHRVRPLPGRLSGVGDRQGSLAEAADHGPPRPAVCRRPRACSPAARPRRSCRAR